MDTEHRHELKTNELAKWLSDIPGHIKNTPNYIKENLWESFCILLIVAGIIWWIVKPNEQVISKDYTKQAEMTQLYQKASNTKIGIISQTADAGALLDLAGEIDQKAGYPDTATQKAVALIKAADALRSNLYYKAGQVDEGTVKDQAAKANEKYEEAFKKAKNASIKAMARFGMALCAEDIRDFDSATNIYNEIIAEESYKGSPAVAQAKVRLANIVDSKNEFTFEYVEPQVEPQAEEATTPEVKAQPQEEAEQTTK